MDAEMRLKAPQHLRWFPSLLAVSALALSTLACSLIEGKFSSTSNVIATRTAWPTFTPTTTLPPVVQAITGETAPTPVLSASLTAVSPGASAGTPALSPTFTSAPAETSNLNESPQPANTAVVGSPPLPNETATASPTPVPTATAIPTQTPIPPTGVPTTTPISGTPGWSFTGVRIYANQYEGALRLVGDMTNNTGTSQELYGVTGIFYGDQGQVIADEDDVFDDWPVDIVPSGGRVPFELWVDGIGSAASFQLHIEAEATGDTPRQDFEFLDLSRSDEEGDYCLTGRLRNSGGELEYYLNVVAILYDGGDGLVNYGYYYEPFPYEVIGDQTMDFQICIDDFDLPIARYDIQAWAE